MIVYGIPESAKYCSAFLFQTCLANICITFLQCKYKQDEILFPQT